MTRVTPGYAARQTRRKRMKLASGFRGAHSKVVRAGKQPVVRRAPASPHRDRYKCKRYCRRPWIARTNAAARNAAESPTQHPFGFCRPGTTHLCRIVQCSRRWGCTRKWQPKHHKISNNNIVGE
uniref:Large ribosomal subunit protein bL20c n=1 Tax=Selaginella moellendorffii TaxID=88036 RepID=C7B2H0_SELML|nr:ribosomal protein L20 [Selaginella moellendorffii]ACT89008.1 ribosomal protein L20 [Selaginella moellendorffii]ADH10398.1 ribosomal protein L20 [Selaginella moellendorffii]QBL07987.1 ribosomal protein L20 [Selaginella moellendorffii]